MEATDYQTTAFIGDGIAICGIAPKKRLSTLDIYPCENCREMLVVMLYSGSGWYEPSLLCAGCGEDGYGYRPFKPHWREDNIARAEEWFADAVEYEEYRETVKELIKQEMGW